MAERPEPGHVVDVDVLSGLERDVGAELALQLIEMFLDSGPERVDALRGYSRSGDTVAAAETLHSLKSSASTLGATRLSDLAEQSERLARSNLVTDLAAQIEPVERALAETLVVLREHRDRLR